MIQNKDISVIVQGPLVFHNEISLTSKCLETIRTVLPGAEIVLSTWKNEKIQSIDTSNYDILVLNQDPGGLALSPLIPGSSASNVNRQIVSTCNGLESATRKYALKLRTDNVLTHDGFKEYYGRFPVRCSRFKILEERVLALAFGSVNPRRCVGSYWFCDWVQFGLRSDLLNIWDVPLASLSDVDELDDTLEGQYYLPLLGLNEIYVWTGFLHKNIRFRYRHTKDCSEYSIRNTELSFANNLILLELEQFGVESLKYFRRRENWKMSNVLFWVMCYSHIEWLGLYSQYCDPLINIQADEELLLKRKAIDEYFAFIRQYGLPVQKQYIEELQQLGVADAMLPFDTTIMGAYVEIVNHAKNTSITDRHKQR